MTTMTATAATAVTTVVASPRWAWARLLGGLAILGVVVARLGVGPFVEGVRTVDARSLAEAAAITAVTTVCCAWRWSIVARGLGVDVPMRTAVAAYYRSQLLNSTLPGGVLGDVHRALRHGREVGDVSRGLRAVAWERTGGQVVLVAISVVVLLVLPSPVRSSVPTGILAILVVLAAAAFLLRTVARGRGSRAGRAIRTAAADARDGLLRRRAWPAVVAASVVMVAGHTATFLLAARTAGSTASLARLLPIALLVLLAMGVPTSVGGWGPREGVAAWAFAAAGLGADTGIATAVVYGVMVLVATLPGAVVLAAEVLAQRRNRRSAATTDQPSWRPVAVHETVPCG